MSSEISEEKLLLLLLTQVAEIKSTQTVILQTLAKIMADTSKIKVETSQLYKNLIKDFLKTKEGKEFEMKYENIGNSFFDSAVVDFTKSLELYKNIENDYLKKLVKTI